MRLVIDANELFSAIIAAGRGIYTKKIEAIFSDRFELCCPELLFREISNNSAEIALKSSLSDSEFEELIEYIKLRVELIPVERYADKLFDAKAISPHDKDMPYFAVALALNCAIWSGEKKHKLQTVVKVYNTKDLVDLFGL